MAIAEENLMTRLALVVDDSMLVRHTVCRFLEQRGFAVETACNGVDALEVLSRARPDLIVTDIMMPRMTGGELIDILKADPATASIPILILAGRPSFSGDQRAGSRAQGVIYKDIDVIKQLERGLDLALHN
jgi:CheY-like chemotaxis protein